jgi:uncharacterized protein YcbK (DUF882 family)
MVLVPGQSTLTFELNPRWPQALLGVLFMTMMTGAAARRCLDAGREVQAGRATLRAGDVTGHIGALRFPEPSEEPARIFGSTTPSEPSAAIARHPETLFTARAPSTERAQVRLPDLSRADEQASGWLRLEALHLGESLRIRPFDAAGAAQPEALDAVRHLMRCRITGEEVPIDPRLVRILTQISEVYNRPIQLVSGHRKPYVIGTKPTSQHALGRAADIRVPGVGIEQLRALAIRLGARGVGLYPEKGFVHVDVRDKARYFWTYSEEEGEEADSRPVPASASPTHGAAQITEQPDSESASR